MKARCIRILEGGRHDGREIESSARLTVGTEYVVLAIWSSVGYGTQYAVLGDPPYSDHARLYAASMFEITDSAIPSSWRPRQPYPPPSDLVTLEPASFDEAYDQARDSSDPDQRNWGWGVFVREVKRIYEEAGETPPSW